MDADASTAGDSGTSPDRTPPATAGAAGRDPAARRPQCHPPEQPGSRRPAPGDGRPRITGRYRDGHRPDEFDGGPPRDRTAEPRARPGRGHGSGPRGRPPGSVGRTRRHRPARRRLRGERAPHGGAGLRSRRPAARPHRAPRRRVIDERDRGDQAPGPALPPGDRGGDERPGDVWTGAGPVGRHRRRGRPGHRGRLDADRHHRPEPALGELPAGGRARRRPEPGRRARDDRQRRELRRAGGVLVRPVRRDRRSRLRHR